MKSGENYTARFLDTTEPTRDRGHSTTQNRALFPMNTVAFCSHHFYRLNFRLQFFLSYYVSYTKNLAYKSSSVKKTTTGAADD